MDGWSGIILIETREHSIGWNSEQLHKVRNKYKLRQGIYFQWVQSIDGKTKSKPIMVVESYIRLIQSTEFSIYIYTHTHTHIYTHAHIYIHTHIYTHTYTHTHSRIMCSC